MSECCFIFDDPPKLGSSRTTKSMSFSIVSLRSLILLTLVVSLIDAGKIFGSEAKNVVERDDDDESGDTKVESGTKELNEETTKSDEDSAGSSTTRPTDSAEDGSRSAAAAAAAAASASASAGGAIASASASVSDVAELAAAASSASASASSSASSTTETTETTEVVETVEDAGSRSGAKAELATTKKPADKETTIKPTKSGTDEKSDEDEPDESEDDKSAGPAKDESEGDDKGVEEDGGESRAGLNFMPKASAGFDFDHFKNAHLNKTFVLSLNANLNGGSDSNSPSAKATPGPALILNKNGTQMISEGGTVKPIQEDKAKEIVEQAKNDPKSFKLETYESFHQYDQTIKESNSSSAARSHQILINGQPTTPGPQTTKEPIQIPVVSTVKPPKPILPTSPPASSTTTTRKPNQTTTSTKPFVCPTCAACINTPTGVPISCGSNTLLSADFQASDKLLAIAVTNKGYFKGRRINVKAIEKIMQGKLNGTISGAQIEKGITISTSNSFVFPAGHYYFPHPVRFAGFQSP